MGPGGTREEEMGLDIVGTVCLWRVWVEPVRLKQ